MASRSLGAGIICALGAAVLFGISTPLAKLLVGRMDPWLLAGLLYLGSGMGMGVLLGARRLWSRGTPSQTGLTRSHAWWLAAATLSGGIAAPVLLAVGLTVTAASHAALLLNLESVFTGLLAWLVVREHTDRRLILGMAAIVAGGAVLALPQAAMATQEATHWWGALAIAGACLCWGIDNTCTRPASAADPLVIVAIKGCVAGTVNVAVATALGTSWPGWWPILAAGIVGLLGYGISLVLFVIALRHLGSGRTGAYFSIAPFVGAAVAMVLGDPVSWAVVIAGLLMGVGVWLHLSERHEHEHRHEAEEHSHVHVHDEHHLHQHASDDPPGEPHAHVHRHEPMVHSHAHMPDLHHRHSHS